MQTPPEGSVSPSPALVGEELETLLDELGSSGMSKAQMLLAVSNRMAAMDSLDEQLAALVEITVRLTGADRGSLFLNDSSTGELYSRIAHGLRTREIRVLNTSGIAGAVFHSGEGVIIADAYEDERFEAAIDRSTGYKTKTVLCAPIRTMRGDVIGVIQALNKKAGEFTEPELATLESIATQASVVLQASLYVERMERAREQEADFLRIVSEVSSEIQLGPLLQKIMDAVTRMLNCERSTLFLNDEQTNELYTEIGQGLGATRIRFPNHLGIAGTVFTTGETVTIPYAYADLRFNPSFDKQTGFFTRSILCVPVVNKDGKTIGVTQVLNKRGGPFTDDDEARLRAFTAQISIGLENAKLFADVQNTKNYVQNILESMSNGVVTLDAESKVVTCNTAGLQILRARTDDIVDKPVSDYFTGDNSYVVTLVDDVLEAREARYRVDTELTLEGDTVSANLTALPLTGGEGEELGALLMIEDISSEKRIKNTMSRYMDPALAEQLMESGESLLGGQSSVSTVLFSDVRSFTTMTEELGAQGTVALLNEYFTVMVECIQKEGGMLDKFIGDAIMAVFGTPLPHEDDEDRAMRTSIEMMRELQRFNEARASHGLRPIDIGIGMATANIVSGNIGSPKRMDYTCIGDGVNLAARLESACKQYGSHILASEGTVSRLRGTYRTREIDRVVVKGKTEPVAIYEVLDYHTKETFPSMSSVLGHFRDGIERYRSRVWGSAEEAFEQALRAHPEDRPSRMYIERCAYYRENPPPEDWGGEWTMTTK